MNKLKKLLDSGDDNDSLSDAGMHLLMEDVTEGSMRGIIEWIIEENLAQKKKDHLTLIICSPGGDVNACFAAIDTMKGSSIPIHTVGLGMIASCGLLLFMSGEPKHRTLTPNTSILSHQFSWGSWGKEHELFSRVHEFELTSKRILEHYKKCTGLKEADIRKYLLPESDVWLDAKEAKRLNICDNIKTTY